MILAEVIGSVVSTTKTPSLTGFKLLLVQPVSVGGAARPPLVAADVIGAGIGEKVLVAEGAAARHALGDPKLAIDAAVVGIVDSVEVASQLPASSPSSCR